MLRPPVQVECQTLARQLQDAQAKLAAAREESKSTKRRAELLEGDLLEIRKELKHVMSSYEEAKQKSGKQEVKIMHLTFFLLLFCTRGKS